MRVIFAVYSRSQWTLPREIARRLKGARHSVGIVWFGPTGEAENSVAREAEDLGCIFLSHETYNLQCSPQSLLSAHLPVSASLLGHSPLPDDHPYRILVRRQIAGARSILRESSPSVLIVCEDGPGGDAPLIEVARHLGIPVLVVPYGIGESRDYDIFLDDKARENCLNLVPDNPVGAFIRQHAPQWVRKSRHGDALLFPAEFVAARILEGLDLPNPWAVQGGNADRIAVESEAMLRHYVRENIPESKLEIIGSVYCDAVYDGLHEEAQYLAAYEEMRPISDERISVLLSLPPDYHSSRASLCQFPEYRQMWQSLMVMASDIHNMDLTVSIHPNTGADARAIINACGAKISHEWLVSLIPKHDIFFTDFSTTLRWAITARKPTVNYDMYAFRLPTYDGVPGFETFERLEEAMSRLKALCTNRALYRAAAETNRENADDWGTLDGKNFDRLIGLIGSMQSQRTPQNPA